MVFVSPSPRAAVMEPSLRVFAPDPMILSAVPAPAAGRLKEVELASKLLPAQELLSLATAAVQMICSAVSEVVEDAHLVERCGAAVTPLV